MNKEPPPFSISIFQNPYARVGGTLDAVVFVQAPVDPSPVSPLAIGVVIDCSSSMFLYMKSAQEAASVLINSVKETTTLMVVGFAYEATVVVPPTRFKTPAMRKEACRAVRRLEAYGGTSVSLGLGRAVRALQSHDAVDRKILFLTDGGNDEPRERLVQAVAECRRHGFQVTSWGLGGNWVEDELRYIAEETLGQAGIIPNQFEMARIFREWLTTSEQTVATHVKVSIEPRPGFRLVDFKQLSPTMVSGTSELALGSLCSGERRAFLVRLEGSGLPGERLVAARPHISYTTVDGRPVQESAASQGWIYAQWSQADGELAETDPRLAHYVSQERLAVLAWQGQAALGAGKLDEARDLLTQALTLSVQTGNDKMTQLLRKLVVVDAPKLAANLERKTLALYSQRVPFHPG